MFDWLNPGGFILIVPKPQHGFLCYNLMLTVPYVLEFGVLLFFSI